MADVFVIEAHRGKGLGRWLVECMLDNPGIERCRRLLLATTTAPWLYEKLGFSKPDNPDLFWQVNRPDMYKKQIRNVAGCNLPADISLDESQHARCTMW
jgi:GNAT superfamily N-acetyltransferase